MFTRGKRLIDHRALVIFSRRGTIQLLSRSITAQRAAIIIYSRGIRDNQISPFRFRQSSFVNYGMELNPADARPRGKQIEFRRKPALKLIRESRVSVLLLAVPLSN